MVAFNKEAGYRNIVRGVRGLMPWVIWKDAIEPDTITWTCARCAQRKPHVDV